MNAPQPEALADDRWDRCGADVTYRTGAALWGVGIVLLTTTSCYITHAGGDLEPIAVVPTGSRPTLEYGVDSGPAYLNQKILKHWKDNGYIASATSVESLRFTGTADYNLTIDGFEWRQSGSRVFLNAVTFNFIPRTDIERLQVRYNLQSVRTGQRFTAQVTDSVKLTFQLFILLAYPWMGDGYSATSRAMADHLYQQLKDAGAFGSEGRAVE